MSDLLDRYARCGSSGMALAYRLMGASQETKALGPYVWTGLDSDPFLDFGGYGVFLFGHRHPSLLAAATRALDRMPMSSRILPNAATVEAAELLQKGTLCALTKVLFTNSGAEATELAMKTALIATGRPLFAALQGAFHGKTLGALSLMDSDRYKTGLSHVSTQVHHVSPGDLSMLDKVLRKHDVAALFVEPIQSENGVFVVDPAWLRDAAELASCHGTKVVVDEVSTGLGRTGSLWCSPMELLDRTDMLLFGKGASGGIVPCAGVMFRENCFAPYDRDPLLHTSTFAGNPLACSVLAETLRLLDLPMLCRISEAGSELLSALHSRVGSWPLKAVRGKGLLLGLEFESPAACGYVVSALVDRRVLVVPALRRQDTLRLTPPAVATSADFSTFMSRLDSALDAARRDRDVIDTVQ